MISVLYFVEQLNATCPIHTGPERPYVGGEIGLEKERHADAILRGRVYDTVRSASPLAVSPSLHHVSDVDDECARYGIRVDPGAVSGFDLESARG
jgi:hypothetical protein